MSIVFFNVTAGSVCLYVTPPSLSLSVCF